MGTPFLMAVYMLGRLWTGICMAKVSWIGLTNQTTSAGTRLTCEKDMVRTHGRTVALTEDNGAKARSMERVLLSKSMAQKDQASGVMAKVSSRQCIQLFVFALAVISDGAVV